MTEGSCDKMALYSEVLCKVTAWRFIRIISFRFCRFSSEREQIIDRRTYSDKKEKHIFPQLNTNSCQPWFTLDELSILSRQELQNLCQRLGIKAIGSTKTLKQNLVNFYRNHLSNGNSILHYPFAKDSNCSSQSFVKLESSEVVPLTFPSPRNKTLPLLVNVEPIDCWVSAGSQKFYKTRGARGTRTTTETFHAANLEDPLSVLPENNQFLQNKPSVSTILNSTSKGKLYLISRWRKQRIEQYGKEAFEQYTSLVTRRGSMFHSYIASVLSGDKTLNTPPEILGLSKSVACVLENLRDVIAIEKKVYHVDLGYTGILDTIATYRGISCVIEWKTSEKVKPSLNDCYEYPVQSAAYAGAVNSESEMKGSHALLAMIVIAYPDGRPADIHIMDLETCWKYWRQWLLRLLQYKQSQENNQTS